MSSDAASLRQPCRHLGFADTPSQRLDYPSQEHRCHLWQLRDRIDIAHQSTYCLTAAHKRCPWLSVPPPGERAKDRRFPVAKVASGGGIAAVMVLLVALVLSGALSGLGSGRVEAAAAASPNASAGTGTTAGGKGRVGDSASHVIAADALTPAVLQGDRPLSLDAKLQADTGGTVLAGNVGLSFSPKALSQAGGEVTVKVDAQPPAGIPGGPAQYSPSGTIVDISVHDRNGHLVTTFPDPVDILFKYNQSDLAMARGDAKVLTAAYVIDADSPELENPLHFPIGTWVFFPPSNLKADPANGTIAVQTQAIGSIFSIVAAPVSYAQTLRDVQLFSSFDPRDAKLFGAKKQNSTLQVVEPQIGTRVLTRDPDSGNYAYVNARDLGPVWPASDQGATSKIGT